MFYHGPKEHGKDILYWDAARQRYGAVVAKAKQVHAEAAGDKTCYYDTLRNQIQSAFNPPSSDCDPLPWPTEITVALSNGLTPNAESHFSEEDIHVRWPGKRIHIWKGEDICYEYERLYGPVAVDQFDCLEAMRRTVKVPGAKEPTLRCFPEGFKQRDLVIVVGERRERPPRRYQDVVAKGASPADLAAILRLGLHECKNVEIWTDAALLENWNTLGRGRAVLARSHILSVGSPQVNLISRELNECAPFRFLYAPGAKERMAHLESQVRGLNLPDQWLEMGGEQAVHDAIVAMRGVGLIDLMTGMRYETQRTPTDQNGLVALCKNPYQEDPEGSYCAILAAGSSLYGTWGAVRALAAWSKDKLISHDGPTGQEWAASHPIGGIVRHTGPLLIDSIWSENHRTTALGPLYRQGAAFRSVFHQS